VDDIWATKSEDVGLILNLYGHDPPTSWTDEQTDDMRLQDRALHYSASRGKNGTDERTGARSLLYAYCYARG